MQIYGGILKKASGWIHATVFGLTEPDAEVGEGFIAMGTLEMIRAYFYQVLTKTMQMSHLFHIILCIFCSWSKLAQKSFAPWVKPVSPSSSCV